MSDRGFRNTVAFLLGLLVAFCLLAEPMTSAGMMDTFFGRVK